MVAPFLQKVLHIYRTFFRLFTSKTGIFTSELCKSAQLFLLMELTHDKLVDIAYRWVLANGSCGVAFKELVSSGTREIPDVIGFGAWEHSVLVEVKVSRSDFLSDKGKSFRKNPEQGMGRQRFYCCPSGIIKVEDLPAGWGLLWVNEKGKCRTIHCPYKGNIELRHKGHVNNLQAERGLMYSALRRLHLRGRIEEIYAPFDVRENNLKI